jgi:hypothetical protein
MEAVLQTAEAPMEAAGAAVDVGDAAVVEIKLFRVGAHLK